MAAAQAAEAAARPSGWERAVAKFSGYFAERGLGPQDIPKAIVIHEVVGLAMAIGFWTACYVGQPSRTLARPLAQAMAKSQRGARMQQAYSLAMAQATATVQKLSWLRKAPGVDPARLTVSLAESLCLRATIKPITFPFKLWAAYKLVLVSKRWGSAAPVAEAGSSGAAAGSGSSTKPR